MYIFHIHPASHFGIFPDCDAILASGFYKEAGAYRIYLNQSEPVVVSVAERHSLCTLTW
ncbi:hypothetical protein DPMN_129884 [Dreissena polymorpha]|uniref:Uncharacterized protein n=1 Tax=Dreissena polymorpha TaxID=45954 RepID=A0A9D4H5R5_DREPO|nr:hypothetical protein DPMN_129884 [Dreissena polymorpha]